MTLATSTSQRVVRAALVAWEARLEAIRQAERTPSNVVRLGQRAVA